jgi:hypothetical protein
MASFSLVVYLFALVGTASGLNLNKQPILPSKAGRSKGGPRAAAPVAPAPPASWTQDAWERYVLIRPSDQQNESDGMWASRTPGTARTIIFSSILCSLAALPALVTKPAALALLVELAALGRLGITPMQMLFDTGHLW